MNLRWLVAVLGKGEFNEAVHGELGIAFQSGKAGNDSPDRGFSPERVNVAIEAQSPIEELLEARVGSEHVRWRDQDIRVRPNKRVERERSQRETTILAELIDGQLDVLDDFDRAMENLPEDIERYRAGEKKVLNFLMGQVMKRTQGKANPGAVREILLRKLEPDDELRKPADDIRATCDRASGLSRQLLHPILFHQLEH